MLTPDLLSWTLGATVGINRWSSERNAKTDFEHSCLGKRQSRAAESRQRKAKPSTPSSSSVATLCESGIAERALNKQAQKVKYVATDIVAEEPETPSGGGSNGGGGGNNPPGELEE